MARLVRPTWAIRCTQSGCKQLFEVAVTVNNKKLYVQLAVNTMFTLSLKKQKVKTTNL